MADIRTVAVVGAGTMGVGIAQVAAQAGCSVLLHDLTPALTARGLQRVQEGLARMAAQGRAEAPAVQAAISRVRPIDTLAALAESDLLIEAITEDLGAKQALFRQLGQVLAPSAILASNTSSFPIGTLAAVYPQPAQVVGLHFFNPVPAMELVEVVRGAATAPAVVQAAAEFVKRLGKTPVEVPDVPGFLANRILFPFLNEAIACVEAGLASPEQIDRVARLAFRHPLGPLELADRIGLDVCLQILEALEGGLHDPKYHPRELLRQKVAQGHLGRKTGQGFYRYPPE